MRRAASCLHRNARPPAVPLVAAALLAVVGCNTIGFEKSVSGRLLDCDSAEPIADATVSVEQRGWGWSGDGIVWDKTFKSEGRTTADGSFRLSYRVGSSAHLFARKTGYCVGDLYAGANSTVTFRLKRGPYPDRLTYTCHLFGPQYECPQNPASSGDHS